MEIKFQIGAPENWSAEVIIVLCCENEKPLEALPVLDKICPWLAIAPALRDFTGKKGRQIFVYGHPELKLPRALLCGMGPRDRLSLPIIRDAVADGIRLCREYGLASVLLAAENLAGLPGGKDRLIEESIYAANLGLYQFSAYKTKGSEKPAHPAWLAIASETGSEAEKAAAARGEMAAWAVCMARDLDNLPGSALYPETMALRAIESGQKYGFSCTVADEGALEEMGAGCLLAVGHGSSHPPRMIILEYAHPAHKEDKPLVFVGKGITFDSGGLCIKPAANMWQMKCDMSGAAAVLSSICAAAREKIRGRVVGVLSCAENMPDGRAYRPGDILYCLNGESVEVINTDAEGRLALADALSYVCRNYSPSRIIDIATLTGACAIALGTGLAGLFCADDDLAGRISALGAVSGENYWRMPLWEPYKESLKSEVADIKHTGAREGGAITAALFLQNFVSPGISWAHLDIAGVDFVSKRTPLCTEGASGFGTRTLLELARRSAE